MSPEFMGLHSQYIDKFGDEFNTVVMSDDEEKWDWMIEGYERNVKLYKNYAEKSLKHKMHMNDQYNINFKKCEKEFRQNPLSLRAKYE